MPGKYRCQFCGEEVVHPDLNSDNFGIFIYCKNGHQYNAYFIERFNSEKGLEKSVRFDKKDEKIVERLEKVA